MVLSSLKYHHPVTTSWVAPEPTLHRGGHCERPRDLLLLMGLASVSTPRQPEWVAMEKGEHSEVRPLTQDPSQLLNSTQPCTELVPGPRGGSDSEGPGGLR